MPKILYFITQAEFGGAQRYVFDLANNLKADFQVAVAFGESGNNLKLAKILDENNLKYFIIPHLKRSFSPIDDLLAFFEIIKLIKNYRPDIIHLNSSKISVLGSLAALCIPRSMPHIIYTVHGWVFNEPLPAGLKYFYLYAEKLTAKFKNKIICVSEYDRLIALKYKIAPAEKLVTIHNGLTFRHSWLDPESSIQKIEQISRSRIRSGMTNNLIIGSIGNLYKTKGYEYLIEAANILISGCRLPLTFIIIGDGSERKNLENLIEQYHLANNFILAGQIDEAARLLKAFDIYVCSSVKEGLPYSILEAQAAGLPIVSTNVGGIPEMIENNKTGLLSKPANAQSLADTLQKLIGDKNLQIALGENAKQTAGRNFSLEKMIEATRKIYLS